VLFIRNCIQEIFTLALVPSSSNRYSGTMFDVLVYLYETYYRPDACPDSEVLVKKLSAVGFEEEEISKALGWLTDLAESTNECSSRHLQQVPSEIGFRIYAGRELEVLGSAAIGFIHFLESAKVISPLQREVLIERALAASESQISLDKLKVIVLMVLWSQGKEPDSLIFDELFFDEEDSATRLLH
jgi:Smg protein